MFYWEEICRDGRRSEMTLIWDLRYAAIMLGTMMFIARTEWQMTENIIMSSDIIIIITITLPFCSTNWDHPLQGVRRQVQRSPLRSHHVWGMQGKQNNECCQNHIPHSIISRVSSGGLSRVWQITSVPGRRTAWWTEWTGTGASSAASRSAWRWACPEMVSTLAKSRAVAST